MGFQIVQCCIRRGSHHPHHLLSRRPVAEPQGLDDESAVELKKE